MDLLLVKQRASGLAGPTSKLFQLIFGNHIKSLTLCLGVTRMPFRKIHVEVVSVFVGIVSWRR